MIPCRALFIHNAEFQNVTAKQCFVLHRKFPHAGVRQLYIVLLKLKFVTDNSYEHVKYIVKVRNSLQQYDSYY